MDSSAQYHILKVQHPHPPPLEEQIVPKKKKKIMTLSSSSSSFMKLEEEKTKNDNDAVGPTLLPLDVLTNCVLPYVSDRKTWNNMASTCHEIQNRMKQSTIPPPWPSKLSLPKPLGFGSITAIGFASHDASFSSTNSNASRRKLMACGTMSRIDIFDSHRGHLYKICNQLHGTIRSIDFVTTRSSNHTLLAACSSASNPKIWTILINTDHKQGESITTINNCIEIPMKELCGSLAVHIQFAPGGQSLMCISQCNTLWTYDLRSKQFHRSYSLGISRWFSKLMAIHVVAQPRPRRYSNTTKSSSPKLTVATTGAVLKLVTLDASSNTTTTNNNNNQNNEQTLNYSADVIHHFAFSSNGQYAIAGGDHGIVQLWKNIDNNNKAAEPTAIRLRGLTSHVVSVSFSTDNKYVAAVGMAGAIKVWNVQSASLQNAHPVASLYDPSPSLIHNNSFPPSGINQIKFTPDGNMLAATGNDGSIRFWSRDAWDRQC